MAWCDVVEPRPLRDCRIALGQSQAAFAAMLGVPPESYRTWDTGRRVTPPKMLARARALATHRGVGARMRAGLRASNRRARHRPMRYETGLPSAVIRFRT